VTAASGPSAATFSIAATREKAIAGGATASTTGGHNDAVAHLIATPPHIGRTAAVTTVWRADTATVKAAVATVSTNEDC
jgi:hypothetical protein